jgi:hypothetical protein
VEGRTERRGWEERIRGENERRVQRSGQEESIEDWMRGMYERSV